MKITGMEARAISNAFNEFINDGDDSHANVFEH